MPARNSQVQFFGDFRAGVILRSDTAFTPLDLQIGQLIKSENVFWRSGLLKRKGMRKFSSLQPNGSNSIRSVRRLYRKNNPNALFVAVDDSVLGSLDDFATAGSGRTGWATDANVFMTPWGATEKLYVANGINPPDVYTISSGAISVAEFSNAPATSKEFIVHRERLFTYHDGLDVSWSDNLAPETWPTSGNNSLSLATHDPEITGAIKHTQNTSDNSIISQLLFFTDNTTWVLAGNDFTATLSDVLLQEISGHIGTSSPKTIVKTPKGVIFFGRDQGRNNVFLVVGQGVNTQILPIGDNLRQILNGISPSNLKTASAVYFDGYYRLSFRAAGQISNKTEWWLRIDQPDDTPFTWFGPMTRGIGIESSTVLSGGTDRHQVVVGSDTGYLYELDSTRNDDGTSIDVKIQTGYHYFGEPSKEKIVDTVFANVAGNGGTVTLKTNIDFQSEDTEDSKTITLDEQGGAFPYTFPFNFAQPTTNIQAGNFSDTRTKGVYISTKVEFSELNEDFMLNSLGIKNQILQPDIRG